MRFYAIVPVLLTLILSSQATAQQMIPVIQKADCKGPLLMQEDRGGGDKCASAAYDKIDRIIYVSENKTTRGDIDHILKHEYAHDVWYHQLSEQKKKYFLYWHKKRPFTPTSYSRYSGEENFAELYAYIISGGAIGNYHFQGRFLKSYIKNNEPPKGQFQPDNIRLDW